MNDELQWIMTTNGRQPPMEDDLQWKTISTTKKKSLNEEDFKYSSEP
jgi:hypothetical protein